ncbi:MAG: hypothetical protein ACK6DS_16515 [Planctomycetota bacterium]
MSEGLNQVDPCKREAVYNRAIWYAIAHLADHADIERQAAESMAATCHAVKGFDVSEGEGQRRFKAACEALCVNVTKIDDDVVSICRANHAEVEKIPGSNLRVRVRADLRWDFRESWDFRDSAILCGVYAGIGDARFRRLDCNRIRALAMGFSSVKELQQYGQGIPELTDRQVRYTLRRLEMRGLFQRATPDLRNFYYSHRLNQEELDNEIAQMAARKRKQRPSVKERQKAIMAQIEELRAGKRVWSKKQSVR